ncbi:MAG: sugar ABC transporter permease [Defluviitaleaceae bacterium]|nr:sugar ABC transporter permease [Defluviitaleaceae bacterium]
MKKKKSFSLKRLLASLLIYLELLVMLAIVVYPILWLVGAAFSPLRGAPGSALQDGLNAIPRDFTLANFRRLFDDHNFSTWYRNTLTIAVLTMIGTVLVHTFMGFIFARLQFKGRKIGLLSIMILQMFPSFLALTAIWVIFLTFGLLDNIYALVLLYVTGGIPFSVWLVRGYMLNIPKSLDEAAYLDGATKLQVFTKVIFPLSKPIIAFIAFSSFISPWMDWIFPNMVLRSSANHTLAMGLFELADVASHSYDITAFTAAALIVGVPIAVIYFVFQRYLLTGLTAGANKGE